MSKLDVSGLPVKDTKHLGVKTNRFKAPNNLETTSCEMCSSKMEWDKSVGYYFCSGCVYSKSRLNNNIFTRWGMFNDEV